MGEKFVQSDLTLAVTGMGRVEVDDDITEHCHVLCGHWQEGGEHGVEVLKGLQEYVIITVMRKVGD